MSADVTVLALNKYATVLTDWCYNRNVVYFYEVGTDVINTV
jgi:hypothetical protein